MQLRQAKTPAGAAYLIKNAAAGGVQPLFIILTSPVILSTLTEYFVYPATLLSSPALVRKEDTFTSASGYDLISPALMPENASFMQPLRRPYFCLFFVVLIFYLF